MTLAEARASLDVPATGRRLHDLCAELFPICRSITGDGVRTTLKTVGRHLPVDVHEVPTGTPVLDWTVPQEWNIRDAYVADAAGTRVIDFRRSNLHVLGYSVPVRDRMPLERLRPHLHTLPDQPGRIPYRTSYYRRDWGFCLREADAAALADGEYEVVIDSSLQDGSLTYGEVAIPGDSSDEILLSCHVCHPSLANDNLSGIAIVTLAGRIISALPNRRYSYRLLFVPGTIGSITWLSRNLERVAHVRHGLVVAGVGDPGPPTYKRSRRGDTDIDRAAAHVLAHAAPSHQVLDFSPYGYDERQFCSPGFNLAVGRFGRSPHGTYPEYHTSGDDLDFVQPDRLAESLGLVLGILDVLERDATYRNLSPMGEPQLGRRGLYGSLGAQVDRAAAEMAMLWVLNLSDGTCSLLDVAERSGLAFEVVRTAADRLVAHDLLAPL